MLKIFYLTFFRKCGIIIIVKKRMEIDIMDFMTELGKKIDELGAELDELEKELEKLKEDTAKMHKEIDTLNNKTKAENEKLRQFLNKI